MHQSSQSTAHFLLVGDSTDLATLRRTVDRLPVDAYGQIYVEVATSLQIEHWDVPAGMTVHWLCRDRASGVIAAIAPRGELAARAVGAWVEEWMPERGAVRDMPFVLWIGCSASERVDELYRELSLRIDHAHMHHPHAGH